MVGVGILTYGIVRYKRWYTNKNGNHWSQHNQSRQPQYPYVVSTQPHHHVVPSTQTTTSSTPINTTTLLYYPCPAVPSAQPQDPDVAQPRNPDDPSEPPQYPDGIVNPIVDPPPPVQLHHLQTFTTFTPSQTSQVDHLHLHLHAQQEHELNEGEVHHVCKDSELSGISEGPPPYRTLFPDMN